MTCRRVDAPSRVEVSSLRARIPQRGLRRGDSAEGRELGLAGSFLLAVAARRQLIPYVLPRNYSQWGDKRHPISFFGVRLLEPRFVVVPVKILSHLPHRRATPGDQAIRASRCARFFILESLAAGEDELQADAIAWPVPPEWRNPQWLNTHCYRRQRSDD